MANVPNTDWLEVYYDAKDLADGTTTVNDLKPVGTAINGTANGNTTVPTELSLLTKLMITSHWTRERLVTTFSR